MVAHGIARLTHVAYRIGLEYQLNTETVAAVIAALSPNNKWERNCKDAENVIAAFMLGDDNDALNVKVCTYGKNLAKAVAILQATHCDYETILKGPKVMSFIILSLVLMMMFVLMATRTPSGLVSA
jgi:hypothetical protein